MLNFRFLINQGLLILEFGMPWRLASVDLSTLAVRDELGFISVSLSGSKVFHHTYDVRYVTLDISSDLSAIQNAFLGNLNTRDDVQLSISMGGFLDEEGRSLAYASTHAVTCIQLTVDVTPPRVTQFELDLFTGTMEVSFDEPVILENVVVNKFAVQNTNNNTDATVRIYLESSRLLTTGDSSTILRFDLSEGDFPSDRDRIHLTQLVGLDFSSCYLFIEKGSVRDTATPANFFPQSDPLQVPP